jgi:hypothetical protein
MKACIGGLTGSKVSGLRHAGALIMADGNTAMHVYAVDLKSKIHLHHNDAFGQGEYLRALVNI